MKKTKRFLLLTLLCGLFLVCFSAPGYAYNVGADGTQYERFYFGWVDSNWSGNNQRSLKKVTSRDAVLNMTDPEGGGITYNVPFNIALSNGPNVVNNRVGFTGNHYKSEGVISIPYNGGGAKYIGQTIHMWISLRNSGDGHVAISGTWSPK